MPGRLLSFLRKHQETAAEGSSRSDPDEFHLAAAVLLLWAGSVDGNLDRVESDRIRWLTENRFGLSTVEARDLIEAASRKADESVQILGFTRAIKDGFTYDERVDLMEMLWEVVLADEVIEAHEAQLMRRIAGLIYVDDRDSGRARTRARENLQRRAT